MFRKQECSAKRDELSTVFWTGGGEDDGGKWLRERQGADQGNAFFTDAQNDLNGGNKYHYCICYNDYPDSLGAGTEVNRNIVAYLAELTQMKMVIQEAIFK